MYGPVGMQVHAGSWEHESAARGQGSPPRSHGQSTISRTWSTRSTRAAGDADRRNSGHRLVA